MGKYSIRELEKLSGIKAHTIRIWEKRYNLIEPQRTPSNIRFYSDDDLKKIINVSMLNTQGIKISVIAGMTGEELNKKVHDLASSKESTDVHIDRLITCMLGMDEEVFERELKALESKLGFEETLITIVYPFLQKIGVLWQTSTITPAHEHFISNLIRQHIIVAIAALPLSPRGTLRAVLFLPEGELHEIGLLFYHYLARKAGLQTYYLGQSVPLNDLRQVCSVHLPHLLITSLTCFPTPQELGDYLNALSTSFPSSRILASGTLIHKTSFSHPANLKIFETAPELQNILMEL